LEDNPNPYILLRTYIGFYVAVVQEETVSLANFGQNQNIKNIDQFSLDTTKLNTKKIELEELFNSNTSQTAPTQT
jgi:hypothetical protein